ncbi:MAG: threonine/serine dehydratase [Sphingomonadales bacterium]|nr:threonine/serine dehydratase [Sphingomonadales bacterium]
MQDDTLTAPSLDHIKATHQRIDQHICRTPVHRWRGPELHSRMDAATNVYFKLELLQITGTFKSRGAINNALALSPAQIKQGITTISAGNHAIAASYAAAQVGASAKVVMMATANPARIAAARQYGAEVLIADDIDAGFALVKKFQEEEGRAYIPSFPNKGVVCGTGTISLELMKQVPNVDAIVVPIGGGGLISGIAACVKQLRPQCKVYGVEALGAGVMSASLKAGSPQKLTQVDTIADSISPPLTNDYALAMVSQFVDDIVKVSDDQMAAAAALLFSTVKFAVEPAGAASTAALLGPLRQRLQGKTVALILCGSNIDAPGYARFLAQGTQALADGVL